MKTIQQANPNALFRFVYEDPVIAVLIGILVAGHPSAALGLALFFVHALFAAGAGMTAASLADMAAARRSFFDRVGELRLHRVSLTAVASKRVLEEVRFRPSFARPIFRDVSALPIVPIQVYWVEVLRFPAPTEWRAYSGTLATRFIFMLERPSRLSAFTRFRLLHELHHVSIAGVGSAWQRHVLPFLAPVSVLGAVLAVGFSDTRRTMSVLVVLLVWLAWELSFVAGARQLLAEVQADEFAVRRLPREDRALVLSTCFNLWRGTSKRRTGSLFRRVEWHLRLARMASAVADEEVVHGGKRRDYRHQSTSTGRMSLALITGSIFIFGPLLNIGLFFLGMTLQPPPATYLLIPAVAAIVQFRRLATLLSCATKEFQSLQQLLVKRGLAR